MIFNQWLAGVTRKWLPSPADVAPKEKGPVRVSNDWLWTCRGECFGYRAGDVLYTYDGRQAGRFTEGDEVYGRAGQYMGEIRKSNRLVTNLSKKKWCREGFLPQLGNRFRQSSEVGPIEIHEGFEDFPTAKQID